MFLVKVTHRKNLAKLDTANAINITRVASRIDNNEYLEIGQFDVAFNSPKIILVLCPID